jgi:S-adenosylmethionine hydrolase
MSVVTFLSDYGHADEFVGVCHGVIARIAPEVRVIDLAHGIPRHDVRAGAVVLRNALPYMPAGVHLAVVDPEVGSPRRAVALRLAEEDRLLVGPDNGLLAPAAERFGGVIEAVDVSASEWRLQPVAATFHGRDLFAPVAAHLALGEPLAQAGAPLDPDDLRQLDLPRPTIADDGSLVAHALLLDSFGNVVLDAGHEDLVGAGLRVGARLEVAHGDARLQALYARTFADVEAGSALVYEDAARTLAVAVNRGSAAAALGVAPGDELRIAPA